MFCLLLFMLKYNQFSGKNFLEEIDILLFITEY